MPINHRHFLVLLTGALVSYSTLYTTLISANDLSLMRNEVRSQPSSFKVKSRLPAKKVVIAEGHYDEKLATSTLFWNLQDVKSIPLNKSVSLKPQYRASLLSYFKQVAVKHGANKFSIGQSQLKSIHDTGRGGLIARYQQVVDGIEVFSRSINVLIDRDNNLVASSGYYSPVNRAAVSQFNLDQSQAFKLAFQANTGVVIEDSSSFQFEAQGREVKLSNTLVTDSFELTSNSRSWPVYYSLNNDSLRAAYYVEAETRDSKVKGVQAQTSAFYSYVIDAENGEILYRNNLIKDVTTTYRIFADSVSHEPYDGPQGNALTPHPTGELNDTPAIGETFVVPNTITLDHGPISTQDPWLSPSATTTSGNNVNAYADISGQDGFDANDVMPTMTGPNAFEYEFASFDAGLSGNGQKHAVVSLFYLNNYLHDWFFDNGFDELAGNAQLSNYLRGGLEGDPINAEAQDFDGLNNANMSVPSDGASPRMQMFVFDSISERGIEIDGLPNVGVGIAEFGPDEFDVNGILSLVNDDVAPVGDGCESLNENLSGKVALIDRGNCNFTVKVKFAQDAGALAVIIANNNALDEAGGGVITMGGTDNSIIIPSLFVAKETGDSIKLLVAADSNLQARVFKFSKLLDGTLDNGIVAHEWGHYLTDRLVGNANGLTNNQGSSMAEGWSDFIALLMMVKENDRLIAGNENFQGVYSASSFTNNAYFGFRRVPYSTDMNKNALTFKHIEDGVSLPLHHPVSFGVSGVNNSEVHASGEVWAVALWEGFVALLNKSEYSFEQAREVMKDYLVAGLKMTPNAPTMLEARDAFLTVVLANNAEDFELIRDAFAKRGMGAGAIAPDRLSEDHQGVVEDLVQGVDLQAFLSVSGEFVDGADCDQDGVLDVGEAVNLDLSFKNYAASGLPQFSVNMGSNGDASFSENTISVNALTQFGDSASNSLEVTLNNATTMQSIELSATVDEIGNAADDFVEPAPITFSSIVEFDFEQTNTTDDMSVTRTSLHDWQSLSSDGRLFPFSIRNATWHGPASAAPGATDLVTPIIKVAATGDFVVSFEHFYFFESSEDTEGVLRHWDGGVIEVSVDGAAWRDVVDFGATLSQPYNGAVDTFNDVLADRQAYTQTRDLNDLNMSANSVTFPEGLVNGQNIRLRFRIGTDANTSDFGWMIDNFVVTNALVPMFSDIVAEDNQCVSVNSPQINAGANISVSATDGENVSVSLAGSASDLDNDILTVNWTQRLGPQITLNNAESLSPSFNFSAGSQSTKLIFELTVSDGGHIVSDVIEVNVLVASDNDDSGGSSSGGGGSILWLLTAALFLMGRPRTKLKPNALG